MNKKITGYMIVKNVNAEAVGRQVNEFINIGFQPLGGLCVVAAEGGGIWYCQALVQYEK